MQANDNFRRTIFRYDGPFTPYHCNGGETIGFTELMWMCTYQQNKWELKTHHIRDINKQNKLGYTALMILLDNCKGREHYVEMLLQVPGINPNLFNLRETNALKIALYRCLVEVVEMLLKHPDIDVNAISIGRTMLEEALVCWVLNRGAYVSETSSGKLTLHTNFPENSASLNSMEIVRLLLSHPKIKVSQEEKDAIQLYFPSWVIKWEIIEIFSFFD